MNHVFGLLLERKLRQGGNTKQCKTYICNQQLHQLPPHHWVCSSRVLWQSAAVSEKKLEVINPSQLQNHYYVFVTTAHIDLLKINLQAYPCTAYFNLVFFCVGTDEGYESCLNLKQSMTIPVMWGMFFFFFTVLVIMFSCFGLVITSW